LEELIEHLNNQIFQYLFKRAKEEKLILLLGQEKEMNSEERKDDEILQIGL